MSKMNIEEPQSCFGCGNCVYICSHNAIHIVSDEEGFYKSHVDEAKCVNCGLCTGVCPVLDVQSQNCNQEDAFVQKYYAVRHKDPEIVKHSSSGGVFSGLAQKVLDDDGAVYGVCMNQNLSAVYSRATEYKDVELMRGSKYVQAYMPQGVIKSLLEDVRAKRKVLFSGTSCIISGMRKLFDYLSVSDETVCWVDLICSGVISPEIINREVDRIERSCGSFVSGIDFRNKDTGWRDYSIKYLTDNNPIYNRFAASPIGIMLHMNDLKLSHCSSCEYHSFERISDITLGDFWNNEFLPRSWDNDSGVSIAMINSLKGYGFFCRTKKLEYLEVNRTAADSAQLHRSNVDSPMPLDANNTRQRTWNEIREDYDQFISKHCRLNLVQSIVIYIIRPIIIKSRLLRCIRKIKKG